MRFARPLALTLCVAPLLSGCSGVTESMSMPALFGGSSAPKETPEEYRLKPTCPTVEIRQGTESWVVYASGKAGTEADVRYQASIQRVARDCDIAGDSVTVRVGVAGRVVAGPKGGPGVVQVPLRVVVTGPDGKPLYSRAQIVPATISAPDYSALWTLVDDQVRIPSNVSADSSVYVGIDDQALKGGGAVRTPAKKTKG